MKSTHATRNKNRDFDSEDSMKRAAKLDPIKKSGKERHVPVPRSVGRSPASGRWPSALPDFPATGRSPAPATRPAAPGISGFMFIKLITKLTEKKKAEMTKSNGQRRQTPEHFRIKLSGGPQEQTAGSFSDSYFRMPSSRGRFTNYFL